MKRNRLAILLVSVFFVLTNWSAFAKKAEPALVQQEEGYYYGYGKGATAAEAERAGKRDLVESALTAAVRSVNPKASRIQVSDASVKARINDIKPYVQSKKNEPPAVTYRMKIVDWDKKEKGGQKKKKRRYKEIWEVYQFNLAKLSKLSDPSNQFDPTGEHNSSEKTKN